MVLGQYEEQEPGYYKEEIESKTFDLNENLFANVLLGSNYASLIYPNYETGGATNTVSSTAGLKKRGSVRGVSERFKTTGRVETLQGRYGSTHALENRILYNKIWRQLECIQLTFYIPYTERIQLGSVLNLTIPANPNIIVGGVNVNYSGRYLVKSCMSVGHGTFYKKITVVRPGINLDKVRKEDYV
jgi:hypothetical protein